ncbi:PDR/VanB family oxidoreductase [Bradyrhizobium manausense]|uniref:PDR/VanB family oxidoreductase n=1 Tax=Bradyrhizobium manausense TaxID=989370 RepID=UPI001BAA7D0A|nr:PDR/VanB family oxidoreductase [Bradyrhizobium manausense]MBR0724194.1 oxidoreductase [Bradyrhizobium manausense]
MPERDFELVITRIDLVAKGILRLTLAQRDGAQLPAWDPGAHVDLHFVSQGVEYVRQYSLCGRPTDRHHWQVAVLLVADGRGGSAHIHQAFAQGDTVRVTGPRNNFPLVPAQQYLFIAGGIGITPILPMIAHVSASGADWRLLYCGRSVESMAFIDDVNALGADRVVLQARDARGRADLAALIAQTDRTTEIYCCGPESMLRAVDESCASSSHDRVHVERFSPSEGVSGATNSAFEVEFARSGVVVTVPADRSILEMAEEFGVDIDSSCQDGVCGTCETKVISGTPDHRDSVLGAKERAAGQTMMVCVSRSCSARLVLDA